VKNFNNSNTFKARSNKSFRGYKHPRVARTVKRNSVFSLISDYIEKKGIKPSSRNNVIDEGLYFQIFGMCILTVAIVLTFQSFVNSDSLSINAEQAQSNQVRLLTNFQYQPDSQDGQARLQDFSITPIAPASTQASEIAVPNESSADVTTPPVKAYEPTMHTVVDGDNVYTVAAEYKIKPQELIQRNSLIEPYTIKVGDSLVIK
jgi:LysM repeat protein